MSAQAAKLMVDNFYEKMMEDLDRLPVNTQEWIKWMQEMFNGVVCNDPWALRHVPYFLKTKEMCIRTVEENPWQLKDVPDNFKTQEIYDKAVRSDPSSLSFIPDHFKTQEMCNEAVRACPYALRYVPDRFITQEMCEDPAVFLLFLTVLKHKKCVKWLLKQTHGS